MSTKEGTVMTHEDYLNLLDELEILSERITNWTAGAHIAHDHLKAFLDVNDPQEPPQEEPSDRGRRMHWYECSNGHKEAFPSQPKKCLICKCPMDEIEEPPAGKRILIMAGNYQEALSYAKDKGLPGRGEGGGWYYVTSPESLWGFAHGTPYVVVGTFRQRPDAADIMLTCEERMFKELVSPKEPPAGKRWLCCCGQSFPSEEAAQSHSVEHDHAMAVIVV
jgi:hypothetical protein